MPERTKISHGVQKTLLGLDATQHANPQRAPDNVSFVSRYSQAEGMSIAKALYVQPEERQRPRVSASGIASSLKPKHREIGNKRLQTAKLAALAPEIEQSRILVSSSIMSPNDLQDGEFVFNFDNVPSVQADSDLASAVNKLFDQYFNQTLSLAIKSYDWIGDIQYKSGAVALLLLPPATQAAIRLRTEEDRKNSELFGIGMSAFEAYTATQDVRKLDYLYSGQKLDWATYFKSTSASVDVSEMVPAMESYGVDIPHKFRSKKWRDEHPNSHQSDKYAEGLEHLVVDMKTKLEEGDVLRVSENPEILRFNTQKRLKSKDEIRDKLKDMYGAEQKIPDKLLEEDVIALEENPKIAHFGHPSIIELPVESVIPIFIPGAPSEHLGYFILLDQNGQPLTIENSGMADSGSGCTAGTVDSAYEAVFGANGQGYARYFGGQTESNIGQMVFDHLVDGYLKTRMQGIFGRNDLTLSRFNAVSTMLFYRVLQRKHTTLVFAPTELLHYFAFDYNENGSGKSKTDEIQFLLSLRTTFMLASVMSAARNAVEHRQVKFTPSDQETNIEGFMDQVANVLNANRNLSISTDPSEIMTNFYTGSTVIVPTKIPGQIDSLEIDAERTSGNAGNPVDDKLLEDLTNLLVSKLDVPPAALNQLSEPEYSRSLVVNNLFFAKKISRYQRIWCDLMAEFIKSYIRFDPIFKKALAKVLEANGKAHARDELPEKTAKLAKSNPNAYDRNLVSMTKEIEENFTLSLPTPNIVVDKAQFNEIRDFVSTVNEIADMYFPEDLCNNDDAASDGVRLVKAKWKRDQFVRFVNNVGSFKMVELEELEELGDGGEIVAFRQVMQNIREHIEKHDKSVTDFATGAATYGGSGGSDMGGGMDSGGGMDFDFGGEGSSSEGSAASDMEEAGSELGF